MRLIRGKPQGGWFNSQPPGAPLREGHVRVSYQEQFVEGAGGVRLAVRDYGGSGSPIVLSHGLGGNLHHMEILSRSWSTGIVWSHSI